MILLIKKELLNFNTISFLPSSTHNIIALSIGMFRFNCIAPSVITSQSVHYIPIESAIRLRFLNTNKLSTHTTESV